VARLGYVRPALAASVPGPEGGTKSSVLRVHASPIDPPTPLTILTFYRREAYSPARDRSI
jgi:hypothetical protein